MRVAEVLKRQLRTWVWIVWPALAFTQSAGDRPPTDWIRSHATPLQTVEAGHGFYDMQPLASVVGDARIVALGEATHGTREFFQLKHRMVEFLATQKGFTVFSIEANMPEAYRLNDFVLNGTGDPKQLLKGMYFWTWNTEEVLDMILWMREFNRSGKGRIEFTGFDMQTPEVAMDIVKTFVATQDKSYAPTLASIYQEVTGRKKRSQLGFGVATAKFPLNVAAGKHVTYSGYIKTEAVTEGYAGLWWRVDGEGGKILAFDNMQNRGVTGTTPWTRCEISLDVPPNATNINFGVLHPGNGTAWFDSLEVQIAGKPFSDPDAFDLDFESSTPRGFYTGGNGYQVVLDSSVAHTGKQSLRSSRLTTAQEADSPSQKLSDHQLAVECRRVVEHLEQSRAGFLQYGLDPKNVDWVIQNARIVLQYAQLESGEQSRDQSMAENVEWIADHNPGAKIVLWAHNGHIEYTNPPGFDPMGRYLRKRFGQNLVNFGFSFSEGSFRAIETGKGLHEFTVSPLPEGSLDRTLASAGIPLFALDFRQLPKEGQVARWFSEPRAMRSIGAIYSDRDAESPMFIAKQRWQDAFDVILFVEKTTAAHGNP
jgi:erythromycin esterase-like protein